MHKVFRAVAVILGFASVASQAQVSMDAAVAQCSKTAQVGLDVNLGLVKLRGDIPVNLLFDILDCSRRLVSKDTFIGVIDQSQIGEEHPFFNSSVGKCGHNDLHDD